MKILSRQVHDLQSENALLEDRLDIAQTNLTLEQFSFEEKLEKCRAENEEQKNSIDEKIATFDEEKIKNQNLTAFIFRLQEKIVELQEKFKDEDERRNTEINRERNQTEILQKEVENLIIQQETCSVEKSSIANSLNLTNIKLELEETKPDCIKMKKTALFVLGGNKGSINYLLDMDGAINDVKIQMPDSNNDHHYLYKSIAACIYGKMYIFGGYSDYTNRVCLSNCDRNYR